jgi:uncharacterized protein
MNPAFVAFDGEHRIAAGSLGDVVRAAKRLLERRKDAEVLVFDGRTSAVIDIDYRGSIDDVLARLPKHETPATDDEPAPAAPRGPGRPRLGVVAREITLLPRHWDWLAQQKGGASVAIRKLIDEARRNSGDKDRTRLAQDAAYRFMTAMGGNRPHYEDAIRALFANDRRRLATLIADWPADIRDHAIRLADSDPPDQQVI